MSGRSEQPDTGAVEGTAEPRRAEGAAEHAEAVAVPLHAGGRGRRLGARRSLSRAELAADPAGARLLAGALGNRRMRRLVARQAITRNPTSGPFSADDFVTGVGMAAIQGGQFLFTTTIINKLWDKLNTLAAAGPDPPEIATFRDLINGRRGPDYATKLASFKATLNASSLPAATDLLRMIGPDSEANKTSGGATVQKLWQAYKTSGGATLDVSSVMTLNEMKGVDAWELFNCWTTAQRLGKMFTASMPFRMTAGRQASTKMPNTTVMSSVTKSDRRADEAALSGGSRVRGDVVVFGTSLAGIVARMGAAVSDGWVLHLRVISGVHLDRAGAGTPNEEHSLLVYDWNQSAGEFFCFDPDGASNTAAPHAADANAPPAKAFQSIFFDPAIPRLSTAQDDSHFPVNADGIQDDGVHRYQVVRVFTVDDA